jgi:hypothetical protein
MRVGIGSSANNFAKTCRCAHLPLLWCLCRAPLNGEGGGEEMSDIAPCLQESALWRGGDRLSRACTCIKELAELFTLFSVVSYPHFIQEFLEDPVP